MGRYRLLVKALSFAPGSGIVNCPLIIRVIIINRDNHQVTSSSVELRLLWCVQYQLCIVFLKLVERKIISLTVMNCSKFIRTHPSLSESSLRVVQRSAIKRTQDYILFE